MDLSENDVLRARRSIAEAVVGNGFETSQYLKSCMVELMCQSLKQAQERCSLLFQDHVNEAITEERITELHGFMEQTLAATFRQTNTLLHERSKDRPQEHVHVIRGLSTVIGKELCLDGTMLLDRLIEEDILSETGRESILALPTRHAKVLAFINYMCGHFTEETFAGKFIPILKEEQVHHHLAIQLQEELNRREPGLCYSTKCTFCKMKARVNLRRLADAMYQMGSISESLYCDLSSKMLSNTAKWEELLKEVDNVHVITDALKEKYLHLYVDIKTMGHSVTECNCVGDFDYHHDRQTGSDVARLSDLSSLEEYQRNEFYANLEKRYHLYFEGGWVYTGILEDDNVAQNTTKSPHRFPWTKHRRGGQLLCAERRQGPRSKRKKLVIHLDVTKVQYTIQP